MFLLIHHHAIKFLQVGDQQTDLCDQDAHHHTQLVEGAKGSSQGGGRHLPHVHGRQAGEEAAEEADDQAASDHHLVGGADGGEAHQQAADHGQDVDQEHGATPDEENMDPSVALVSIP